MKNCRNLLILLLLASCSSDPKKQTADVLPVQLNNPVPDNKTDSGSFKESKQAFTPQANADTALALFLFKNYKNFDPGSQFIEYMRWDLQHEKIKPLLVNLYLKGSDKDRVLATLEKNRQAFHDKAVTDVLDGYRNGNGIFGLSFAYLASKNDEVVLPLVEDLLKNPKASPQEKEYAMKVLKNWKR